MDEAAKVAEEEERQRHGDAAVDGGANLWHYAPAKNDFASWAIVAEVDSSRMPSVESSLRRVADGLADWDHRLRAIGNGVDPVAAAYAFVALFACMSDD